MVIGEYSIPLDLLSYLTLPGVFMLSYSTVAGKQCLLSTTSDLATLQLVQRHRTANLGYPHTAIVNCDANGDVYYWCDLNATFSIELRILGYWI